MAKFEIEVGFTSTGANEPEKLIGILNRLKKEATGLKLDLFKAEDLNSMKQAGNNLASVQNEIKSYINEAVKMSAANKAVAGSYDEAQQQLTELGKQIRSAKDGFTSTDPILVSQINQYQKLNEKLKAFDSTLGNNQRRVGDYGSALRGTVGISSEFNRIIQDAPFGIIGVGNNIQQLTSNYAQYAQQARAVAAEQGKTVSSTELLKGAVSGILSPINLLSLGVSLVTSAFTIYTMWAQKSSKATQDASKNVKKSSEEYIESLNQLDRARLVGERNAQTELTTLRSLYRIYQDGTVPISKRKEAYEQIQSLYPDYFKNIKFENEATQKTKKSYDELTSSILATARARAAGDLIAKNSQRQLENEQKINDLKKEQAKNQVLVSKASSRTIVNQNSEAQVSQKQADIQRFAKAAFDIQLQINDLQTDSNILTQRNLDLEKNITKEVLNGAKISDNSGKIKNAEKVKEFKSLKDILDELKIALEVNEKQLDKTFYEKRVLDLDDYQKAINKLIENGFKKEGKEVEDLTNKYKALSDAINNRGGTLAAPTSTPKIGGLSTKEATVTIQDVGIVLKPIKKGIIDWAEVVNYSVQSFGTNFVNVLRNINNEADRSFSAIAGNIFSTLTDELNNVFDIQLRDILKRMLDGVKVNVGDLLRAGVGILGAGISGATKKTSSLGQGLGGALSGAAAGSVLGPVGAIVGGLIGGISGLFGASKARKQERLQEQQLEEQKKQTALLERQNALAYASSIIGRQTVNGVVTGVEVNEFGQLSTRISGQDLVVVIDRANRSRKRGT